MFSRKNNRRKVPIAERLKQAVAWLRSGLARLVPLLFLGVVAVGLPFVIFHGYLHVVSTPYFALTDIQLRGLHSLDRETVLEQAGVVEGANVFEIDPARVKLQLEAMPWVRRARVERRLPATLEIVIEERAATALLVDGASYVVLDAAGEPFKQISPDDPVDALLELPIVTGLSRAEARSDSGQQLIVEALEVVRLAETFRLPELSEVHVDRVMGLSIVPAESGIEIRLGRGKYAERMERLRAVFAAIEREGRQVDYILVDHEEKLNRVTVGSRATERDATGDVIVTAEN